MTVRIGRLALNLRVGANIDSRRLVQLLASDLATQSAALHAESQTSLKVDVVADEGATTAALSRQIARQIALALLKGS